MADREPPDEPEERAERPTERPGERAQERGSRFRRLGRRIMGDSADGERDGRGLLGDAREVFGAVLEGGDKAKSEVVRAVAREVRNYLEELGLKDDLHHLLTNYSLEVHASVNLRRLAESEKGPRDEKAPAKKDEKPAAKKDDAE